MTPSYTIMVRDHELNPLYEIVKFNGYYSIATRTTTTMNFVDARGSLFSEGSSETSKSYIVGPLRECLTLRP